MPRPVFATDRGLPITADNWRTGSARSSTRNVSRSCSAAIAGILLGSTLALRRRGRYGLCFIDGHNDFSYARDPKWRGSYSAAGLDLALATGHGPDALTSLDRLKPYVREEDVAALGVQYDAEDNSFFDVASFRNSRITTFEADTIRARGAKKCAEKALAHADPAGAGRVSGFTSMPTCSTNRSCRRSIRLTRTESPSPN